MAWAALVSRTERKGDTLGIVVHYSDASGNVYDQVITTTQPQSDSWLQDQIVSKLGQLSALDNYQAGVGINLPVATTVSLDPVSSLPTVSVPDVLSTPSSNLTPVVS
jgi:hypothetical protein